MVAPKGHQSAVIVAYSHKGTIFPGVSFLGPDVASWWLEVAHTPTPTRKKLLEPNHAKRPFWRYFHMLTFFREMKRDGARGSIPTAIPHRNMGPWAIPLNY